MLLVLCKLFLVLRKKGKKKKVLTSSHSTSLTHLTRGWAGGGQGERGVIAPSANATATSVPRQIHLPACMHSSRAGHHHRHRHHPDSTLSPPPPTVLRLHLLDWSQYTAAPGAITDMLRPSVKPLSATYQHAALWKLPIMPPHFQAPSRHVARELFQSLLDLFFLRKKSLNCWGSDAFEWR